MGAQNIRLTEALSFRENRIFREQIHSQISERVQASINIQALHRHNKSEEEDTRPMALSDMAKDWLSRYELEGFLWITDAPPHEEPEKVSLQIDLEEIT
mgnify:CR=1 FL=1